MHLSTAILTALAVCSFVKAAPNVIARQNKARPTALAHVRARDGDGINACISTVGPFGRVLPSGSTACGFPEPTQSSSPQDTAIATGHPQGLPPPAEVVTVTVSSSQTSTEIVVSTATEFATTTVMATPSSAPLVFQVPEGYASNENVLLWSGSPKFDDMANVQDKQSHSWQEISAVADAIIHHDSRAITKAFDHQGVKDQLFKNSRYNTDMYVLPPSQDTRKTEAIFEMLTGYKVVLNNHTTFTTSDALAKGLASEKGVDEIPTIVYDTDHGMRPIIMNPNPTTNAETPYRLLDCRVNGTMDLTGVAPDYGRTITRPQQDAQHPDVDGEAYDRLLSLEQLYTTMNWTLSLADEKTLDIADTLEKLKPLQASFDWYYYQNGIPEEQYVTSPTARGQHV
ncbi:hypothetical protein QFC21_004773 [Naganishia friedmannii]|uniref:Uncharacterized protein n=1 Tax=Naganishia friedmannii TaxID=89922 RepID=A0ACC2VEB9_9TREE|nr:hypothetical protein QFC21_004773 [Naganishia friedmannii]